MPKSSVSAGWGVQSESVDECAARVAQLVESLASIHPSLSGWRDTGLTKRQAAAEPVVDPHDLDGLVQRLLKGRTRGDFTKEVIEPLGYSLHWWNGAEDNRAAANLRIHIGATESGNSVVLNLPHPDVVPGPYLFDNAHALLHIVIELFDPESTVWTTAELRDRQREPDRPTEDGRGIVSGAMVGPAAGWANYFSNSENVTFDAGLLPATAIVESLNNGTLVMVGSNAADPPTDDVLQIRRALGYEVPA